VISSNGPLAGTGIVWAHHQKADAERNPYVGATLFALDATDLNKELWDSDMTANDNLSFEAKGVPPVVANGRVYMATFDAQRTTGQPPVITGRVRVYGLKQNNR
jgi:outer membrane protein assembly factor BamB